MWFNNFQISTIYNNNISYKTIITKSLISLLIKKTVFGNVREMDECLSPLSKELRDKDLCKCVMEKGEEDDREKTVEIRLKNLISLLNSF